MNKKIKSIKKKVQKIRSLKGAKAKIPHDLWVQISECCQTSSIKDVSKFIGIDANNASRVLQKLKNTTHNSKSITLPKLIQLPMLPTPILELTLESGATGIC